MICNIRHNLIEGEAGNPHTHYYHAVDTRANGTAIQLKTEVYVNSNGEVRLSEELFHSLMSRLGYERLGEAD